MCPDKIGLADSLPSPELDVGKDILSPVLVARDVVCCPARPIGVISNGLGENFELVVRLI
jgi:hypothetical protein